MIFSNISEIRAHRWAGNHVQDMAAFKAVETFVQDTTNPIAHRATAIRVMAEIGMGLGVEHDPSLGLPDEQLVATFIECLDEE